MIYCDAYDPELAAHCGLEKGHEPTNHIYRRPRHFIEIGTRKLNASNPVEIYKEVLTNQTETTQVIRDTQLELRELKREMRGLVNQVKELLVVIEGQERAELLAETKALPAPEPWWRKFVRA